MSMKPVNISGYVSPIDCFIRIIGPEPATQESNSTYIHEYVHYLQLISTPVGCQSRLRQQWLSSDLSLYLSQLPQPVRLGQGIDALKSAVGGQQYSRQHLLGRLADVNAFHRPFFVTDAWRIFDACFPTASHPGERYDRLRRTRPLDIDLEGRRFFLKDGTASVEIAANALMEYMARLIQLDYDLLTVSSSHLLAAVLDRNSAPYHLPLVFLIQEGILDNPLGGRMFLSMLMILLQVAFLIDPLSVEPDLVKKYGLLVDMFTPEHFFLRVLSDASIFEPTAYLLLLGKHNSSLDAQAADRAFADYLLQAVGYPSVEELLSSFEVDIRDNIDLATNTLRARQTNTRADAAGVKRDSWPCLPKGEMRARQFETYLQLCRQVWGPNGCIRNPLALIHSAPSPLSVEARPKGLAFAPQGQTFWDPNFELVVSLIFHLSQKVLFGTDLSCYDNSAEPEFFRCRFFGMCRRIRNKRGIGFCVHAGWRTLVPQALALQGITVAGLRGGGGSRGLLERTVAKLRMLYSAGVSSLE